jgi:2'-5' RNA ligase
MEQKTAAHVPEDEPIVRTHTDLGGGSDEWAEARREPWHAASRLAQREVRQAHPKLGMPFPHGEEGDQMVGHMLRHVGYQGPTDGAFAARHPDPSKMASNPAWLNGKPGVALHPERWDYGTVAHEAAHHAVMYDHAIAPNTPQTDEQVHGPEWAGHYAQGLNKLSKHADDDFLYHHGRFRSMISEGLRYCRPSDLDDAEKHLPPRRWVEDEVYDAPTRLAAALEPRGAAATHVGVTGYDGLTSRSAMIYLDLPEGAVHHLKGGVDDHHITVVYLGKSVGDEAFAEACRRAGLAAASSRPLGGILNGTGTFPPSDSSGQKTPVFVPAYVPGIGDLRRRLEDLSGSEHRQYRPHVTLAYLEPGDDLPAPHPKVDVRFTHLHVKRGDQVVSFPLGQRQQG